ncbi:MAG: imidazole glycerol phosphate synthase subunit HisH [Solirubrobacterales bacterium]
MSGQLAILDYGMGNLRSVEKAFEKVGVSVVRTADVAVAAEAEGLVLPGVGAFARAMARVRELGFDRLIAEKAEAGTPVLGICLGMQLLFECSPELGGAEGLGLLAGEIEPIDAPGLKVPHIGWEPVRWEHDSVFTEGVESETPFYFVHSLVPRAADPADVLGTASYGGRFACAVERPPLYGAQFHPEKSSAAGLRMLANFAGICASVPA